MGWPIIFDNPGISLWWNMPLVQNPAADTPNKVTNQSPAAIILRLSLVHYFALIGYLVMGVRCPGLGLGLCEKLQNNISKKAFNLPGND